MNSLNLVESLLPPVELIQPLDSRSTFGDCGFNEGRFVDLPDLMRLKIAKDIVRQAMLINYAPDEDDEANLAGDCVTASKAFISYAERLGISGEYKLAIVRRNPFSVQERYSTRHVVVLRKGEDGLYRTIDPLPSNGYAYDTVSGLAEYDGSHLSAIGSETLFYEDVSVLDDEDVSVIQLINKVRKTHGLTGVSYEAVHRAIEVAKPIVDRHEYMSSWMSELYFILASVSYKEQKYVEFEMALANTVATNPIRPKIFRKFGDSVPTHVARHVRDSFEGYQRGLREHAKVWYEQSRLLFGTEDPSDYPMAIRYLQWAVQGEMKAELVKRHVPTFGIQGLDVPAFNLTPRLIQGMTTMWIKPSAYHLHIENEAMQAIKKYGNILWESGCNFSETTPDGYVPIILSHTQGKRNIQGFLGPSRILLVNAGSRVMEQVKRDFRQVHNVPEGTVVKWFDGNDVPWNKHTMNHLHTSDSGAETVLHLLAMCPEFSLINRWSYPHPTL